MPFRNQFTRTDGSASGIPDVVNLPVDSGQAAFVKGRILSLNTGDGELEIHALGATVTGVYAVAQEGWDGTETDGPAVELNAVRVNRQTVFAAQMLDTGGGNVVVEDLSGVVIGDTYGMIVFGGNTYIDQDDTTDVIAEIVGIDDNLNVLFYKFIATAIA